MDINKVIGVDPGSQTSGIIVIVDNAIRQGYNIKNEDVFEFINKENYGCELTIVIENVLPYNMRITAGIIDTIKFLGQIEWRLSAAGYKFTPIARWQVKQWVFLQFKPMAISEIEKNINRANKRKKKKAFEDNPEQEFIPHHGTPTFIYVDDRIVIKAMRQLWGIKNPSRVGEKAAYGLKDHSWQALALCSYFMTSYGTGYYEVKA